jgi:hypothetical protein
VIFARTLPYILNRKLTGYFMEISPLLHKIKDFTERTDTLRGYL